MDILLATDLLSEGVNLHDAQIVVHLDLPWTAARLEQRVGRLRRLGSLHDRVIVYAMHPPAPAETLLQVKRRLLEKSEHARRAIGPLMVGAPSEAGDHTSSPMPDSSPRLTERIRERLAAWRGRLTGRAAATADPRVAAVTARDEGFLALVEERCAPILVSSLHGNPPSADLADVVRVVD